MTKQISPKTGFVLFCTAFYRRIVDDLRQKELIPLKVLFFVHSSTIFVLYPYLTIHMRELGINVEETAIMSAVTPIVAIIMPPVAGMVADRIGNFKVLLALFSTLGGASALLLLLVPVGRFTVPFPQQVPLSIACAPDGHLNAILSDVYPCDLRPETSKYPVSMKIGDCGFFCMDHRVDFDVVMKTANYTVVAKTDNSTDTASFSLESQGKVKDLSHGYFLFPSSPDKGLTCSRGEAGGWACKTDAGGGATNITTRLVATDDVDRYVLTAASIQDQGPLKDITCPLEGQEDLTLVTDGGIQMRGCSRRCLASAVRAKMCQQVKEVQLLDPSLTFWLYLTIRVFIGMIGGTAFAMFEGAVIAILREHRADYGLQRIYATVGGMISSPLSGALISYASAGKDYTDFRPAFYLYAALKIISGLLILTISLEFKTPAKNVVKDVLTVIKNVELVALFIAIFVLGTAWGYIESFLFWLLQDLGASPSLMGITITVGGIAGIPLLVLSGPIIDRIGHANVLFIGFIFYAIRLLGYSLIYNPWLCLVFEAMEGVTSSLSFTAAVTYAAKLSTTSTDTSIQGLLGGLYFGVGKGAGSLVGGFMMKVIGTRPTYRVFSGVCAGIGVVYFIINKFYLRKRPEAAFGNDIVKEKSTFLGGAMKEKIPIKSDQKSYSGGLDVQQNNVKNEANVPNGKDCSINMGYEHDEADCETIGQGTLNDSKQQPCEDNESKPSNTKKPKSESETENEDKNKAAHDNPGMELTEERVKDETKATSDQ